VAFERFDGAGAGIIPSSSRASGTGAVMGVRVVNSAGVQASSTDAAREYVRTVRTKLSAEVQRYGDRAMTRPSYLRLQASIQPAALQGMWPHADVRAALELPEV
jgi:hypothetical protein